ncbi:polysaccharide export outer membrane protein [Porphyromonadaceae bacterium KH3CP3RA]|nr:polysaccharide biosynthesis/export family protein [Proteiniphilum acetatigenes]SFL31813.1 polysaccharide export outer membrane protein [Porphyromonadaceae bacterium KH3CP3RA]
MKRIKTYYVLVLIIAVACFSSCMSVGKISYFQDLEPGVAEQIAVPLEIKVRPNDKISIVVNSKDAELSNLFNLPIVSHRIGMSSGVSQSSGSQQISGYTVDEQGDIDFPVVGKVHVEGLTRTEIAAHIKHTLITGDLVKDPVVTVEFMNLSFSVLGEVNRPGRFAIDRDRMTLLDAIGMAGDLTIYGKRETVYVLREEQGVQVPYRVDLTSAGQFYSSPVYYLQQNDVVYVEPNTVRARQSTVNGNNVRSTSFWISLASLLTSIAVLVVRVK